MVSPTTAEELLVSPAADHRLELVGGVPRRLDSWTEVEEKALCWLAHGTALVTVADLFAS